MKGILTDRINSVGTKKTKICDFGLKGSIFVEKIFSGEKNAILIIVKLLILSRLASVVLNCTYMHPYVYTVSRTTVQLLHRM